MNQPDVPVTPIAIAVVEHQDQFLVARRPAGSPLAGKWEFPGGKLEPDESPAAAAVRECREETGIDIEVIGPYLDTVHHYDFGSVHLHFLACRPLGEEPMPTAPFVWVTRGRLAELDFPAGNDEMLRRLAVGG